MNQLSVFQILKNGTSFKSQNIPKQTTRKSSVDSNLESFEKFHLQKFHPEDSESEPSPIIEKKTRRKESIDRMEQEMVRSSNKKTQKNQLLMKVNKIKCSGDNVPQLESNFTKMLNNLNLDRKLISNLKRVGYLKPTPIQMQAIPIILQRRNLIGIAPTGSGKTAAFALPVLQLLENHLEGGPRCLVFAPSVELASQLFKEFEIFKAKSKKETLKIKFLQKMNKDKIAMRQQLKHVDIMICTPLKFLKMQKRAPVDFKLVQFLIMDECDKYFELGLLNQIKQILTITQENPKLNYLLFSATIQDAVEKLFQEIMIDPIKIQVGGKNHVLKSIDQSLSYCANEFGKIYEMKNLINNGEFTPPVLIFVQSKERAEDLMYQLKNKLEMQTQLRIECIHGNKETSVRESIVERFSKGDLWGLICTDLMARGIDFKGVKLVINFDFPTSMINYIHRVGRTGRAGMQGRAITFFTDEDKQQLRSLANILKISGCNVPEWIFTLKDMKKVDKKHLERFPVRRESIDNAKSYSHFGKISKKVKVNRATMYQTDQQDNEQFQNEQEY